MAVPKRKKSRGNTHARRSQWKAEVPTLVKTVENGKITYSLPHRAKVVEDSAGTAAVPRVQGPQGRRRLVDRQDRALTARRPAPCVRTADIALVRPRDRSGRPARQLGIELDAELLELALTHRSFAYEHGGIPHNERLEFLGDSILGQAVTVMLYREYPDLDEGELAKRRASLVSSVALAEVARQIGLGQLHPARSRRRAHRRPRQGVDPRRHGRGHHRRRLPRSRRRRRDRASCCA